MSEIHGEREQESKRARDGKEEDEGQRGDRDRASVSGRDLIGDLLSTRV